MSITPQCHIIANTAGDLESDLIFQNEKGGLSRKLGWLMHETVALISILSSCFELKVNVSPDLKG